MLIATRLATKHDVNGNPRRGWLISSVEPEGKYGPFAPTVDFVEEEYAGFAPLRKHYPKAVEGAWINVAPSEYNKWVKFANSMAKHPNDRHHKYNR